MHIVSIGFFASDYLITLANALAKANAMTLFVSKQNLDVRFPRTANLEAMLRDKKILDSTISLRLVDYPMGQYLHKVLTAHELVHTINTLKPDVVHYQSGGDPWIPLAMPWLRKYPLVATIHDATHHPGERSPKFFLATTNAVVTSMAHQIIVHGSQQANILIHTYGLPQNKVNVIPIGPYNMFTTLAHKRAALDGHAVLFFGRLRAYKGIEVLLQAAPLIATRIPDVRIIIAGSGDCEAINRAVAEYPNLFEVHNRFIPVDEVHTYFERAAVVVQPYVEASQSGVIPVAYMFGKPVVATRVGSIPEVVEDGKTGYLVEPGNIQTLANAIVHLLQNDALREEMGRAALIKSTHDLSWDVIAAKTMAVYERVQSRHRMH